MSWPFLLLFCLGLAKAAPENPPRAPILRLEGPDIYVPRSTLPPLTQGQSLLVLRAITTVDPAGRTITDHFPVGEAQVVMVGDNLVRLRITAELASRLLPGDLVQSNVVRTSPPPTANPEPTAPTLPTSGNVLVMGATGATPCPPGENPKTEAVDRETIELKGTFVAATRLKPADAISAWLAYKDRWPGSKQLSAVDVEIARLRQLSAKPADTPRPKHAVVAPEIALRGDPVPVILSLNGEEPTGTGNLYFRRPTEDVYRFVAMQPYGSRALRGTIPAEATRGEALDWFVEYRPPDGIPDPVGFSVQKPGFIELEPKPPTPERENRSAAQLTAEYVDFYSGTRSDYYFHGEADFLYRIAKEPLHSIRFGAGTYRGRGAPTGRLDAVPKDRARSRSHPVGYNFGYSELEFHLLPYLGVIGRGLVGVDYGGIAGGAEGRIRLGREDGTNLDAGAARIGDIGNRYALRLGWNTIEKLPMAAAVELTDFPGVARRDGSEIDDFGVRLIVDARYALTDRVELGGRLGYQLRNIDHAGFSGGLQTVFSW